jgi:hypothetical protein
MASELTVLSRWLRHFGERLPQGSEITLAPDERVLATGHLDSDGDVVVTTHGLWLPAPRRVDWHLISRATWQDNLLTLAEAEETDHAGRAVILTDRPPVHLLFAEPGKVADVIHARVTRSIASRHRQTLPGGGAWFVHRRVVGRDGLVLQVRPDPNVDPDLIRDIADKAAERLP